MDYNAIPDGEMRSLANDMTKLAKELMGGKKMGEFAMAMTLDAYADRLNQALGEMPNVPLPSRDKSISPDVPPMVAGGTPAPTFEETGWLEVRERGMKFSRFSTETRRHLLAKEPGNKCQPARLHEITVTPSLIVKGDFEAGYYRDGELKFALQAHSVSKAEKCALAAAKAYMRDSHHNARKNRRGEKRNAGGKAEGSAE